MEFFKTDTREDRLRKMKAMGFDEFKAAHTAYMNKIGAELVDWYNSYSGADRLLVVAAMKLTAESVLGMMSDSDRAFVEKQVNSCTTIVIPKSSQAEGR